MRLPLAAHFLYVDEVESRLYTSGGDSSDESGIMVVTDVLGQLGTNVSVSASAQQPDGTVQLNADFSVTYTPDPGFMGTDQFSYTITAPTGTAVGTVTVNVVPSPAISAAFGDTYTTSFNQLLDRGRARPDRQRRDGRPGDDGRHANHDRTVCSPSSLTDRSPISRTPASPASIPSRTTHSVGSVRATRPRSR